MTDSTPEEIESAIAGASAAAGPFGDLAPGARAELLRGVADALDKARDELVPLAMSETHLPEARLNGELTRTTFQLRLFADELDAGTYLEAIVDPADPEWGMGPRPDLRRMLVPLGPAVVFGASNFPFAFSVAGGDTASALAAGCPVIVKANPGHPGLSARTAEIVQGALPDGVLGHVTGFEAGRILVTDPRIKVGAFTGSMKGGRALFDLASSRPDPIPFYGELGSLNPAFVTPAAVEARGDEIAQGFVQSYTLGVGQFCTKPGFLFAPSALVEPIAEAARAVPEAPMLNDNIRNAYTEGLSRLAAIDGVRVAVDAAAALVVAPLDVVREKQDELLEECFGPVAVVVECDTIEELREAVTWFGGNLTATVHAEPSDHAAVAPLVRDLRDRAGRLVWNSWPTGVSVTHAMHHGGPWPSTVGSVFTSVGTTAIRRFLRPVSYQGFPSELLPDALR